MNSLIASCEQFFTGNNYKSYSKNIQFDFKIDWSFVGLVIIVGFELEMCWSYIIELLLNFIGLRKSLIVPC